jgi:hypothetical protein
VPAQVAGAIATNRSSRAAVARPLPRSIYRLPLGTPVDRKQLERQIRLIVVLYRVETRPRDSAEMARFRDRAEAILKKLEADVQGDAELVRMLDAAHRELWPTRPSPRRHLRLRKQPVDGSSQLGNGKRLR